MRARPSGDFLPLAEAVRHYGVSRARLFGFLKDGQLKRYRRPGDRRTWLSVEELEQLLRPRPEQ